MFLLAIGFSFYGNIIGIIGTILSLIIVLWNMGIAWNDTLHKKMIVKGRFTKQLYVRIYRHKKIWWIIRGYFGLIFGKISTWKNYHPSYLRLHAYRLRVKRRKRIRERQRQRAIDRARRVKDRDELKVQV